MIGVLAYLAFCLHCIYSEIDDLYLQKIGSEIDKSIADLNLDHVVPSLLQKNKADCHKSREQRRTDRRTDQRTDGPTKRFIESRARDLKLCCFSKKSETYGIRIDGGIDKCTEGSRRRYVTLMLGLNSAIAKSLLNASSHL